MSLLYFHAFLISFAALFFFAFGAWEFFARNSSGDVMMGISAFLIGAILLFYLVWFIRKKLPVMRR